ncbi:helix-turn-helix domain-containing protein [Elusimicrobiota bacterium]
MASAKLRKATYDNLPKYLKPVFSDLNEFVSERLGSNLGEDQKAMTNCGVDHLKRALFEANTAITKFVRENKIEPYITKLEHRVSPGYLEHLKDIWRQALRHLCKRKLLDLDMDGCLIDSLEQRPNDPDNLQEGYPEAWKGVYPKSIMPRHTARAIRLNEQVSWGVRREYWDLMKLVQEVETDATRVAYWEVVRMLATDLKLKTISELGSLEGARRLMKYYQQREYGGQSAIIRRIRTIFRILAEAKKLKNPYELKEKTSCGYRYVINFSRLPAKSKRTAFFRYNGKRHTMIDGQPTECRLRDDDIKKIAVYGNPAIRGWQRRPQDELEAAFTEAQENLIARTVLFFPARPMEFWAMNWREWTLVEGDERKEFRILMNNARPHHRKRRPDRVVPVSYTTELEQLWKLRRALFGKRGDIDLKEDRSVGILRPGVPMWVHPKTGKRLSRPVTKKAFRRALLRMGVNEGRAKKATLYWARKGNVTFCRNRSGGKGDKFQALQGGHSEDVMKKNYDGAEQLATAEHYKEYAWEAHGVVPVSVPKQDVRPGGPVASRGVAPIGAEDMNQLGVHLLSVLRDGGFAEPKDLQNMELEQCLNLAQLKAGLLYTYPEASQRLGVELRTLERWVDQGHVQVIRIDGHRYLTRAQVDEVARGLSPEEAGGVIKRSARQVRNLVRDGKIVAITMGKKIVIAPAELRAYMSTL